jgi:hypothetical protein
LATEGRASFATSCEPDNLQGTRETLCPLSIDWQKLVQSFGKCAARTARSIAKEAADMQNETNRDLTDRNVAGRAHIATMDAL